MESFAKHLFERHSFKTGQAQEDRHLSGRQRRIFSVCHHFDIEKEELKQSTHE